MIMCLIWDLLAKVLLHYTWGTNRLTETVSFQSHLRESIFNSICSLIIIVWKLWSLTDWTAFIRLIHGIDGFVVVDQWSLSLIRYQYIRKWMRILFNVIKVRMIGKWTVIHCLVNESKHDFETKWIVLIHSLKVKQILNKISNEEWLLTLISLYKFPAKMGSWFFKPILMCFLVNST